MAGDDMIVVGGQSQDEGCITLRSVFALHLPTKTWSQLNPLPVPLCRIGLVALPSNPSSPDHGLQVFVWGGWDGDKSQNELFSLFVPPPAHTREVGPGGTSPPAGIRTPHRQKDRPNCGEAASGVRSDAGTPGGEAAAAQQRRQHSWNVSRPLELGSLRGEPEMASKLADIEDLGRGPGAVIRLLHTTAVQRGYSQYIDPATGFSVFTSLFLVCRACVLAPAWSAF